MKKILIMFVLTLALVLPTAAGEQAGVYWGALYMKEVERKIKKNWNPPKNDTSASAAVDFKVLKDGKIEDIKLVKSSGVPLMDEAAISALEKVSPLPPLPEECNENFVIVQFTFDYKVKNKPKD